MKKVVSLSLPRPCILDVCCKSYQAVIASLRKKRILKIGQCQESTHALFSTVAGFLDNEKMAAKLPWPHQLDRYMFALLICLFCGEACQSVLSFLQEHHVLDQVTAISCSGARNCDGILLSPYTWMPLQEEEDFGSQQGRGCQTTSAVSPPLPPLFEVPSEYISAIWVPSDIWPLPLHHFLSLMLIVQWAEITTFLFPMFKLHDDS